MSDPKRLRRLATGTNAALAAIAGMSWISGACAMPTCPGTYAATLLHPLPTRIVVDLDIHDRSQRNLMLADRFLMGVRDAGVAVGQDSTVLLHVSTSRLGDDGSRSGAGPERSYPELYGLAGGGMQRALPPLPSRGIAAPRPQPASAPLLVLRVDATEGKATRISWIATVQCQIAGTDEGLLAQELGRAIGGALGKRIERQPF